MYRILLLRFEVFIPVTMKYGVFWGFTPFGSCKNRRFGGTYRFLPTDTDVPGSISSAARFSEK
jgi:hypothetical protein